MATVVAMPVSAEEENAAPTTRPSAKLWRLPPTITITASRGTPCPGSTKGACVITAHPQTMTINQPCQAINYKEHHNQLFSAARIDAAYSDVKASLCLWAQEILPCTPSHPLVPAGHRWLFIAQIEPTFEIIWDIKYGQIKGAWMRQRQQDILCTQE